MNQAVELPLNAEQQAAADGFFAFLFNDEKEINLRGPGGVGKTYLMGEQFTVADVYLFNVTNWAQYVQLDISSLKNLAAYRARIAERPAVQAAMRAEGLLR